MDAVTVKLDSKGRVRIPPELREGLGGTVVLARTGKGILLTPGQSMDFLDEFRRIITSEPRRIGVPENPSPRDMKGIWKGTS